LSESDPIPANAPVRQSITVHAGQQHTFTVFADQLDAWWPLDPFSLGGRDRIARFVIEPEVGGRITEVWHDGTHHDWGSFTRWDPPAGFVMTWNVTGRPTEVELTFQPIAEDHTLVHLEHRGWDSLTQAELVAACPRGGGYPGGAIDRGWTVILSRLKTYSEQINASTDADQQAESSQDRP
jgi:hypothetical protein